MLFWKISAILIAIVAVDLTSAHRKQHKYHYKHRHHRPTTAPPTTVAPTVAELETSSAAPIPTTAPIVESPPPPPQVETSPPILAPPYKSKQKHPMPTLPHVHYHCRHKDDGYYADPKDKCSRFYYSCVGHLARKMDCGQGLVYEPETGKCERPQDSFRCTGTRKTTLPTTPRPVVKPVKLHIDCSMLDDGWYPNPHRKCSHHFYSCSNGNGARHDCPGQMYFDVDTKRCQPFNDVMACSGKKPSTMNPATPAILGTTVKLPIDCSMKPTGFYLDPEKKCSAIYYECSHGEGYRRQCPDGLFFHRRKGRCDYFDDIWACSGKMKPTSVATAPPKPSEASLPSNEFDCKSKKDGAYTPMDKKCSKIYYRCLAGTTFKSKCPTGLKYDVDNDKCEHEYNLFVCTGKKATTLVPATTTKPKPTEKVPIDCSKLSDGDYPDPVKKCSHHYFTCSNSGGTRRRCPRKTFFDKDLKVCDVHDSVPDCSGKPRPLTTASSPKPSPAIKLPFDCEKREDGNYAAGKCVDYYWSCSGGSTTRTPCSSTTVFDVEKNECGYKEEIPACGGVRPTKEAITTTKKP